MNSQLGDILHQQEIKEIIRRIIQIHIKDYGTLIWFKQDQSLQKLNMQLHVNAIMKNDQYILQQLIINEKFKILIYDLIMTATWKEKILNVIKQDASKMNSLKVYLSIYHEAVILNLLEVLMYHRTAIDESGELLVEMVDYCYKKITRQISKKIKNRKVQEQQQKIFQKMTQQDRKKVKMQRILKRTPVQDLQNQIQQMQFNLFIMSISILRYITDYIRHLEIGIVHHLVTQSNIFAVLAMAQSQRQWLTISILEQSMGNSTQIIVWKVAKNLGTGMDSFVQLVMDPECRKKYELNDQRKNMLLRLRKFMNEVLLDQIPNLSAMLRSLEELSLLSVPTHLTTNPFVVQQVPVIFNNICAGVDWKQLAELHRERLKQSMDDTEKQHMQGLADWLMEGFKCGKCGKQAFKRCSKCKTVWYCSRDCQVSDWPNHKAKCNAKVKQMKQLQQKENIAC